MIKFYSNNSAETKAFVLSFLNPLKIDKNVISLSGCLGSGKTFICSQILSYLNINQLNSSSFQGISYYPGKISILHCDFYNHPFTEETFEYNMLPLLESKPWLLLAEWPNDLFHSYFDNIYKINIYVLSRNSRYITVLET